MPPRRNSSEAPRRSEAAGDGPDRNAVRRAAYAGVPGIADSVRGRQRERYTPQSDRGQQVAHGSVPAGVVREITWDECEHPESRETYTIPEFAKAIGRSELTIRRWIEADKLPGPYLRETTRNTRVYSRGELDVILAVLNRHAQSYQYLTSTSVSAIQEMMEQVQNYRANYV